MKINISLTLDEEDARMLVSLLMGTGTRLAVFGPTVWDQIEAQQKAQQKAQQSGSTR